MFYFIIKNEFFNNSSFLFLIYIYFYFCFSIFISFLSFKLYSRHFCHFYRILQNFEFSMANPTRHYVSSYSTHEEKFSPALLWKTIRNLRIIRKN